MIEYIQWSLLCFGTSAGIKKKQKQRNKLTSYIVWEDIKDDLQSTKTVVCALTAK